jgi:biopolymer transport protein ExbB
MPLQIHMRILVAAISLLLYVFPAVVHAWWNEDWSARKKVALTNPAGEVADAPVLIRLHTGNFDFLSANENGSDLRVVAGDDKTELKFHIEKWDGVNQLALVWVKVPKLTASTEAWLYFGNAEAAPASDPKGSYDAASAVFHFNEAAGNPADSGPNGLNSTAFDGERVAASFANGGVKFNGEQTLTLPAINAASGFTLAMWIKPDALDGTLLQGANLSAGFRQGMLSVQAGGGIASASVPVKTGTWHHIAISAADTLKIYVDGKLAGEASGATDPSGPLTIGRGYVGELDEVQISGTVRDAAWTAAQAAQGPDGTLVTLGEDETGEEGGEGSYFGVILKSVTLDGWVVIVILMVMMGISILVMAAKTLLVNKIAKANREFLDAFYKLKASETAALDVDDDPEDEDLKDGGLASIMFGHHDHHQNSTLYRIYHSGMQELKKRVGNETNADLSPQALNAIRATLDGTLVRENQKLNNLMVLLTIAISGGPFLGLLGTVVGVMITFAAIAATGDVNVAAIAPGIAAALVATVAGLAVAIPSLFGYNYLGSRIKTIGADMHVFVDEYIARIAETYSR